MVREVENYIFRYTDEILEEELEAVGCVLLEGPKWCGKTSTAEQLCKSVLYMDRPDQREANLQRAQLDPLSLLEGETPRLIDEWQLAADQIWNSVRYEVDHRREFGQFVLTDSATPVRMARGTHSGTGRIRRLLMRTMSLSESGDGNGRVSLSELFEETDKPIRGESSMDVRRLAYLICRGGWPRAVIASKERIALKQAQNYFDALVNQEYEEAQERRISPEWMRAVLHSYARLVGGSVAATEILKDCAEHGGASFSLDTLENYLAFLRRLFVLEDMEAWNPNLRSRTAIRTSPTRYFTDPSIAAAALGITPSQLEKDLNTLGLLFENMVVRDLRIYMESVGGRVTHYRDRNGLEADAVLHTHDGRYALVEIKLGGEQWINEGAKSLNKLESRIDTDKMGEPVFKAVICGVAPFAYRREDGVMVLPVECLKR